jgi:hypothetical protein
MDYFSSLASLIPDLKAVLTAKGIEERHLTFGGELPAGERRVIIPTDARSEFLANRAMGDWAENTLADALDRMSPTKYRTIHYGDTDATSAGEEGFKEAYLAGKEETRKFGKRPDLLLVDTKVSAPADISKWHREKADEVAAQSLIAIEVRSSKFKALKYMEVRRAEKEATGKKPANETPSFTVKVEDLCIVYRWMEVTRKPQVYVQVFFDSIFAIDVKTIFEIIASGTGYKIDTPAKSQLKATIMIPITKGHQIATFSDAPTFGVATRETKTGRVDAYVVPQGGIVSIVESEFQKLLTN